LHTLLDLPLSEMNTDAAVPGLNRENAYRLEVPIADEKIIVAFSKSASLMQNKIDVNENESRTLAALRNNLLPKLMSGEIRVGETREQLEEVA
jgi:type I restriction enzyme S subunit